MTKGQSTLLKLEGAIEVLQQLSQANEEPDKFDDIPDEEWQQKVAEHGESILDGVTGD